MDEEVSYCYNVTNTGAEPLCRVNVTDTDIGFEVRNHDESGVFENGCLPVGKSFLLEKKIKIPEGGEHTYAHAEGALSYLGCPDASDEDDAKVLHVKGKNCPATPATRNLDEEPTNVGFARDSHAVEGQKAKYERKES